MVNQKRRDKYIEDLKRKISKNRNKLLKFDFSTELDFLHMHKEFSGYELKTVLPEDYRLEIQASLKWIKVLAVGLALIIVSTFIVDFSLHYPHFKVEAGFYVLTGSFFLVFLLLLIVPHDIVELNKQHIAIIRNGKILKKVSWNQVIYGYYRKKGRGFYLVLVKKNLKEVPLQLNVYNNSGLSLREIGLIVTQLIRENEKL